MGVCFGCLKSRKRKAKILYSDLEKGTLDKSLTKLLIDQESDSEEVAAQLNGQGDIRHKVFVTEEERNIIKSGNYHDLEKLHRAQEEKFSSEPRRKRSPLCEKIEPPWVKHSVQMKLKGLNNKALSLFDRKFGGGSDHHCRPTLKQLATQEAKVTAAEEEMFKKERLILFGGDSSDEFEEDQWPGSEGVRRKRMKDSSVGSPSFVFGGHKRGGSSGAAGGAVVGDTGGGDRGGGGSVQLHVVESGRNSAKVLSADEDEESTTYGNFVSFSSPAVNKVPTTSAAAAASTSCSPSVVTAATRDQTPHQPSRASLPDVVSHPPSCQIPVISRSPNDNTLMTSKLSAAGTNAAFDPSEDNSERFLRPSSPVRDSGDCITPDSFVQHLSDHSDDEQLESLTLLDANDSELPATVVANS